MQLDAAIRTHRGKIRARNEDAACLWPQREEAGWQNALLAAVADGMGGHPGGDRASTLTIESLPGGPWPPPGDPRDWLASSFRRAGNRIAEEARSQPSLAGMGTTLVAVLFLPEGAWVASVGDSRLHWIRDQRQVLVTCDHTMATDLVRRGLLDSNEAERHPASHLLTRCLGTCPDGTPDLSSLPLRPLPGDLFLLTSDGLGRAVTPERLPALVSGKNASEAADLLVAAALDGGAPDNVTVVVVRWLGDAPPAGTTGLEFGAATVWTAG